MAKVWIRFTKTHNGKPVNFRIQELNTDEFDKLSNLWFTHHAQDEPFHKASKVINDPAALEEYKEIFPYIIKELCSRIDVVVIDDDSDELKIVGSSIMTLEKKNESTENKDAMKEMIKAPEIKKMIGILNIAQESCNYFDKVDVESCYAGLGVSVDSAYRGIGIATEILKVRSLICKEHGVPLTSAWMTSIGTQKAAAKLGWLTLCELPYADLGRKAGVEFHENVPSCKLMAKRT